MMMSSFLFQKIYLVSLSPPVQFVDPRCDVCFYMQHAARTHTHTHILVAIGYQLAHISLSLRFVGYLFYGCSIPKRNETKRNEKKKTIQNIFFHLSNTCHWHHHTVSGVRARARLLARSLTLRNSRWILLIRLQNACICSSHSILRS